jgi:hypothetical protein
MPVEAMNEEYLRGIQNAIRQKRGCESLHLRSTPITEEFNGEKIWEGMVELFALINCGEAEFCYAWGTKSASGKMEYVTILSPPIKSAREAVMAHIVVEARKRPAT